MKEKLAKDILDGMQGILDTNQMDYLQMIITKVIGGYHIQGKLDMEERILMENGKVLEMFLSAKRVEGCSEKTILYYKQTLAKMLDKLQLPVGNIQTEDLRGYLANYQASRGLGKSTIDNVRRIFSSFFGWLEDEDYITKSPVRRIHKVRLIQPVKTTITDEEMELLRDACTNPRDLAIIDLLASTGIRVGELVGMNLRSINLKERTGIVFGKGGKEREIYFDARTKIHLMNYLESRTDTNPALFVTLKQPYQRITINGIEKLIQRISKNAGVENVHPHKFRRTMATVAIDKGMPIEQVQKLLGHTKIDTTLQYAMVNQTNVRNSHRKFLE